VPLLPARQTLTFECVPIERIKASPHNSRQHTSKQISNLGRSIQKFGFVSPVVIDEDGTLLGGHARVEAARQLGMRTVPAVRACHLSESDKRAFIIADNRLAELASWDQKQLFRELHFLSELGIDYDFSAIGFDTAQVDFVLEGVDELSDRADALPKPTNLGTVSKPSDLWLLGEHRLCCGSALESGPYLALLGTDRAQMVFTDPPYNVRIDGHASGKGAIKHREFSMASGEMSDDEFVRFLTASFQKITTFSEDGAICFTCMDWRHIEHLLKASRALTLKNLCVWAKNNAGMGSLYRSQHELIFVFKNGSANHINNVELGKHGRSRTNVWEYRGLSSFGRDRDDQLSSHPTVKPVALVADAIKDCSRRGGVILDPFGGSGTTLIAAEKTKRRAVLIELDPVYVDLSIRRWEACTGGAAVCARSGKTFAERERFGHLTEAQSGRDAV
jgi:DNA modification methylase